MRLLLLLAALAVPAAAQDAPPTDPPDGPQVGLLPVRRSFWLAAGGGFGLTMVCDPFGRLGTECVDALGPTASLEAGESWWRIRGSGSLLNGALKGRSAATSLQVRFFSIGRVGVGLAFEGETLNWERALFTADQSVLGTARSTRAGFAGLDLGIGDYDRTHVRLLLLPGLWDSTYDSTLAVAGFSGRVPLALDQFALARVRLEGANIHVGSRTRLSGDIQYTRAYLFGRYHTVSSAVPSEQWSLGIEASFRTWSPAPRLHLDAMVRARIASDTLPLTDGRSVSLGVSWKFQ